MSPTKIKELLNKASSGQTDVLKVVDRAFEQIIIEGSEKDLEQTVQIIGNFLTDAIQSADTPQAA